METYAWCFVASLYIISVKAQLYGHGPHQFFEAPPIYTSPHIQPRPQTQNVQGVVLYLSPDQALRLKSTGAIVRPYPGDRPEYDQRQNYYNQVHRYINNFRENFNFEQQRYGELTKVHKPDEHLIIHLPLLPFPSGPKRVRSAMFPHMTTPRSVYTTAYTPAIRHPPRDYHAYTPHAPQRVNQIKIKQGRTRYLPNWEQDTLKNEPLYAEPITLSKNVRPTLSIPENHHTENTPEFDEHETKTERDKPEFTDAEANGDSREPVIHESMTTMSPSKVISDLDNLSHVITPLIKQRSVAREIMDLINEEKKVQTKLQELKKTSIDGILKHAVEVENLKTNMKIRNALAGIIRAIVGMDKVNDKKKRETDYMIEKNVDALLANPTMETIAQITGEVLPKKMHPAPLRARRKPFVTEPLPMVKVNHKAMTIATVHKKPPAPFTSNDFIKGVPNPNLNHSIEVLKHKMPAKTMMKAKPSKFPMKRHIAKH